MELKRYINDRALSMADGKIARWFAKEEGGVHYTVVLSPEELIPFVNDIKGEEFEDIQKNVSKIMYRRLSPNINEFFKFDQNLSRGRSYSIVCKNKILSLLEEFKTLEDNCGEIRSESYLSFDLVADVYKTPIVKNHGAYMDTLIRLKGHNFANIRHLYPPSYRDKKYLELVLSGRSQLSNNTEIAEALKKNNRIFGDKKQSIEW